MWEDLERDCVPSSAPSSVPTSVMALQETHYSSSQAMVINKGQGCAREEKREGDVGEYYYISEFSCNDIILPRHCKMYFFPLSS